MKKILALIITFVMVLTLVACVDQPSGDPNEDTKDPTENQTELLMLTLDELAEFDGKDGAKAYVAVDGDIYDVTNRWTNGEHNGLKAGRDLTSNIMSAPHGKSILDDLEKVGEVKTE